MQQTYSERRLSVFAKAFSFKEHLTQMVFEDFLFDKTDFNHAIFKDCVFKNCVFRQCKVTDVRLFGEIAFEHCIFDRMRLGNDTPWGGHAGKYENCLFQKSSLTNKAMWDTLYVRCVFAHCKWKNVSFNRSTFVQSAFIGKLSDVTFNGVFEYRLAPELHLEIDFSEAVWGDYVGFHQCSLADLSMCQPPRGHTFEELLHPQDEEGVVSLNTGGASS